MNTNFDGINKLLLDLPTQVEYNRRKNVEQDGQISTINSNLAALMARNPAGYLPHVYYGLTRGNQTYRFESGAEFSVSVTGSVGTAFQLLGNNESDNAYIPAILVKKDEETVKILIQGDYRSAEASFTAVNMITGATTSITFESSPLTAQNASYLGDYPASNNKEKQITVMNNLETNSKNVVFASIDINSDGVYNWVQIADFVDGTDGKSIYGISAVNYSSVVSFLKIGDTIVWTGVDTTINGTLFQTGDVYEVTAITPTLTFNFIGNIRGPKGDTGATGANGVDGADGYTPYIHDGYWYINGVNTNVQAIGTDGTDGTDGTSFAMQSGLYSVPANYGQSGNVGPNSETLQQLPTLPTTGITGKGYVVYDPLTTPLDPHYDLYWANDSDAAWTIIQHWNGTPGQEGTDGYTPYIQNGSWYINGVNTGVNATGPQGPTGPAGATFTFDSLTGTLTIVTP